MPTASRRFPVCYALLAVAIAAGCGGKAALDTAKADKVKVGMLKKDVDDLLGAGAKDLSTDEVTGLVRESLTPKGAADKGAKIELPDLSAARGFRWGDDKKSISVVFLGDRVYRLFKKGF